MSVEKEKDWQEWVKVNDDPYGKCCVDVARRVRWSTKPRPSGNRREN